MLLKLIKIQFIEIAKGKIMVFSLVRGKFDGVFGCNAIVLSRVLSILNFFETSTCFYCLGNAGHDI